MKLMALILLMALPCGLFGQEAKLPVFFLKYDGALGSEETEEESIEQSSNRHTVSLRIKEQFSKAFTANLLSAYSRKQYLLQTGSYWYFYAHPYFAFNLSDDVRWDAGFRSKWVLYDERDSKGLLKDYTSLLISTKLKFKIGEHVRLTPSAKAIYDLHENGEKSKQTYAIAFALDARIETVMLGGRYRVIPRFPLTAQSEVPFRFNNEFGASVTWDPNRQN